MSKHLPATTWHTHLDECKHGCFGVVETTNTKAISIGVSDGKTRMSLMNVPRPVARLLAKRILQCLNESS
jgi:hypothetical protein